MSTDEKFCHAKSFSVSKKTPASGAESQAEVFTRVKRCLEDFVRDAVSHKVESARCSVFRIAVFTHENVIKSLMRGLELESRSYASYDIKNLEVTKLEVECSSPVRWRRVGGDVPTS